MKKLIAVLISTLFAGAVLAQAAPATPATPASPVTSGPTAAPAKPAAAPAKPAAAPKASATANAEKRKDCEAQAKEKGLKGSKHRKFVATCLKN